MLYFRFRENANNCGTQAAAAARANANLKKNHNKFFHFVTFCHRHSSEYCVVSHFSSSPCLHCISFTFYAQIPCMDTHFILLVFDKWHTHLNAHILTSNLILHFHPNVVVVRVFIISFIHSFLCVCQFSNDVNKPILTSIDVYFAAFSRYSHCALAIYAENWVRQNHSSAYIIASTRNLFFLLALFGRALNQTNWTLAIQIH